MATQSSANPKNLFAFLLGMLTLTQGLVLPTKSLLLRRAAKVQKRNHFPIANGFTGPLQKARCHEEVLLESLTRPVRHQTPVFLDVITNLSCDRLVNVSNDDRTGIRLFS
jgi:hypothetical protein